MEENQKYTKEISDKLVEYINKNYKKEVESVSIDL